MPRCARSPSTGRTSVFGRPAAKNTASPCLHARALEDPLAHVFRQVLRERSLRRVAGDDVGQAAEAERLADADGLVEEAARPIGRARRGNRAHDAARLDRLGKHRERRSAKQIRHVGGADGIAQIRLVAAVLHHRVVVRRCAGTAAASPPSPRTRRRRRPAPARWPRTRRPASRTTSRRRAGRTRPGDRSARASSSRKHGAIWKYRSKPDTISSCLNCCGACGSA